MKPSPVDAPNRASRAARWAKPAHILSRSYKTREGALGAAYRLSVLLAFAECHVWELETPAVFVVRSGEWDRRIHAARVVAVVNAVASE